MTNHGGRIKRILGFGSDKDEEEEQSPQYKEWATAEDENEDEEEEEPTRYPCPDCGESMEGQGMYADEDLDKMTQDGFDFDEEETWVKVFVKCPGCDTVWKGETELEAVKTNGN